MQVGDIVVAKREHVRHNGYLRYLTYTECVVRYVYPKDHETMSGQCVIHHIGYGERHDEALDINSERIFSRRTDSRGPPVRMRTDWNRSRSDYGYSHYSYSGHYYGWRPESYWDTRDQYEMKHNGIM